MTKEQKLDFISQAIHAAIRSFQILNGETPVPQWDEAGDLQQQTKEGVEFALRNPIPGAQHKQWLEMKKKAGWVYGPVKDAKANPPTHPDMVSFDRLPVAAQLKDRIFTDLAPRLADIADSLG